MTYVYYIDILFLVNWMMNVSILLLTGKCLRRRIRAKCLCLAAAVGALWACVSAVIEVICEAHFLVRIIVWGMDWLILPLLMVRVAYGEKERRELLRGLIFLYGMAVLLGGVIHAIWENTRLGHFWQVWMAGSEAEAISIWLLALSMAGGLAVIELGRRYRSLSSRRENIQEVTLCYEGRKQTIKAFWDSGNQLRDPCTGKGVHIVETEVLQPLLGEGEYQYLKGYLKSYLEQGATLAESTVSVETEDHQPKPTPYLLPPIRLIPCRSLGSAHTLLPVFSITKIILADGGVLQEPLIGVSPVSLSDDGSFCMLLHAQTDEMRRNQSWS